MSDIKIESEHQNVETVSLSNEKKEESFEIKSLDDRNVDNVVLVLKNGNKYKTSLKLASISNLIKKACEDCEDQSNGHEIFLHGIEISEKVLNYIFDFMKHHDGKDAEIVEKQLKSSSMKDNCKDEFDAKFIDGVDDSGKGRNDLYDLIYVANYLDIQGLLHLGCAKVASLIKGQPLDQIDEILKLPEDKSVVLGKTEDKSVVLGKTEEKVSVTSEKTEEKVIVV